MIARIIPIDGPPRDVTIRLADRIAWEAYAKAKGFKIMPRVSHAGTDRQDVDVSEMAIETQNAYQAWNADTRGAAKRLPFPVWLEDVDSITEIPDDADADTDPTRRDPGPASSAK